MRHAGVEEEEGEEVESGSIWLLGLLRCYAEMLQNLPETMRPALVLQVGKYLDSQCESSKLNRHEVMLCLFPFCACISGCAVPVSSAASYWREPFVPATATLPGLLLLFTVQTAATPANVYQVPYWFWPSVHCQFSTEESRGMHGSFY